ncbi:MAG: hypothetical protein HOI95_29505, partial [Chromatiales bacterium]|nr:hypothetical protein [Chromatiales bacterium]
MGSPNHESDPALMLNGCFNLFRLGLIGLWYRDVVRPRILETAPVVDTIDDHCEIHALTCASDWLDLMCGLKSFYACSQYRYRLCIHDDGTLDDQAIGAFSAHFPAARIVLRSESDSYMGKVLALYPKLADFRKADVAALKALDFPAYLQAPRMLQLDSHVVFVERPNELLKRILEEEFPTNAFAAALKSRYDITPPQAREWFGIYLVPMMDTGVGLLQREAFSFELLESLLSH